jgi:uncharacterized protein (UPF0128 family)
MKDISDIKKELLRACVDYANERIDVIQDAIISAKQAANEETKSSAGDKYETGRAMMHLEIENQLKQLGEAQRLSQEVKGLKLNSRSGTIEPGSLVITDMGNYFLSIGAGKISLDETDYFAVGSQSPIGQKLLRLRVGDTFELNGKTYTIEEIH